MKSTTGSSVRLPLAKMFIMLLYNTYYYYYYYYYSNINNNNSINNNNNNNIPCDLIFEPLNRQFLIRLSAHWIARRVTKITKIAMNVMMTMVMMTVMMMVMIMMMMVMMVMTMVMMMGLVVMVNMTLTWLIMVVMILMVMVTMTTLLMIVAIYSEGNVIVEDKKGVNQACYWRRGLGFNSHPRTWAIRGTWWFITLKYRSDIDGPDPFMRDNKLHQACQYRREVGWVWPVGFPRKRKPWGW